MRPSWRPMLPSVLSLATLLTLAPTPSVYASERPNILLFHVDDLGWSDTSVPFWDKKTRFNKRYRTPHVQKLAEEGMKFTTAYACTVCTPSRVSLMTGMSAARHRVTNWTLRRNKAQDNDHPHLEWPDWAVNGIDPAGGREVPRAATARCLPRLLRKAGYRTIHVGKAHFGAVGTPAADPKDIGFEVNIGGHAAGGPGSYLGTHNFSAAWRDGSRIWDVPDLQEYHGREVFLTEALTREARDAVRAAVEAGAPFFLHMSHYAVHVPYAKNKRFYEKYREAGLGKKEAMYAALIEGMDASLGDLLELLRRLGHADDTVVLFISDNGGLSAHARGGKPHTHNAPLSSGKGSAHEGGIRVPMLVRWPGVVEPGTVTDRPVIIEDFYPTLLEIAGVGWREKAVQTVDGISFLPLLRGKPDAYAAERDRPLYWHFPNGHIMDGPGMGPSSTIRKGPWKLIYYHGDQSYELFNLEEDIGEDENLAEERPKVRRRLAARLGDYLRSVDAQMPTDTRTGEKVPYPGPESGSSG